MAEKTKAEKTHALRMRRLWDQDLEQHLKKCRRCRLMAALKNTKNGKDHTQYGIV